MFLNTCIEYKLFKKCIDDNIYMHLLIKYQLYVIITENSM